MNSRCCLSFLLPGIALLLPAAPLSAAAPEAVEFFEKKIRPLLAEHCQDCHGEKKQKGGLRLDTRAGWTAGGDSGAAIVLGKPEESLLIKAVRYTDKDLRMPPKDKGGQLTAAEVEALEQWVRAGAIDPREAVAKIGGMTESEARSWWSFQPVRPPPLPRAEHPVDAFIDAKIAVAKLPTAPAADARTLLRRMTFDLIGLPPAAEQIADFEKAYALDPQAAVEQLADRLLASPQYGEQWARHWLDVVRYADSLDDRGRGKDGDILDSWRYRDWVVKAFNRDLPYDQFITDQIAGDLLAAREWDPGKVVATAMYAIGNWGNGDADKEKVHTDIVDDQIDVTGRAFLGLTLGCARCHDHKFDPITQRDYYGMAGFFFSSRILARFASKGDGERLARWPLLPAEELQRRELAKQRIAEIDAILSGSLQPLTDFRRDILGKPGLHGWSPKGADNPSVVINTTNVEQAFITIKLPARAIALHPGKKLAATAVWKSPVAGKVRVSAKLRDADPNCGNGIEWELRRAGAKLGAGAMDNGGSAEFPETETEVKKGDLVQLIIRPRGEYSCDSTQTEFLLRGEDGTVWDLRDTLVSGAPQGFDGVWWICSGEGSELGGNPASSTTLNEEKQRLTASLANDQFTQGLQEGGIPATVWEGFHDAKIHQRGRYDRLGDTVPRSFPAILAPELPKIPGGSGRVELARWVASATNPLTARVMVNRLWQHHFGEGLVRTENNFGKLGTPPTHPELLDWLASELLKSGWSVKHVQRLIVTSAAYRRATSFGFGTSSLPYNGSKVRAAESGTGFQPVAPEPNEAAHTVFLRDPDNFLLTHFPRRRLTAEQMRDAMLAVTGELDSTMGGTSVLDLNSHRRTLYITSVRSNRSDFKSLFDGADSTGVVEQRTESTVAPQALWLMNHPFVIDRAKALAAQVVAQPGDRDARLAWLFSRLFAARATDHDRALAARAVGEGMAAVQWEPFCQALLCSNQFIYVD